MSQSRNENRVVAKRGRRLRWLAASGGLLILAAVVYLQFFLYLPMGSGPAGPAVEAADFAEPWTERRVVLVGLVIA